MRPLGRQMQKGHGWPSFTAYVIPTPCARGDCAAGELTYLSIVPIIIALEAGRELVRYEPTIARDSHPQSPRQLWLTPETRNWCFPAGPHPDSRIRDESLANLHDQLNAFV